MPADLHTYAVPFDLEDLIWHGNTCEEWHLSRRSSILRPKAVGPQRPEILGLLRMPIWFDLDRPNSPR